MDGTNSQSVFAYGSLVNRESLRRLLGQSAPGDDTQRPCRLRGYRRCWNVAMDNREDVPGYKWYRDPVTGGRPPLFVTFLNLRPAEPADAVNGVAFRVSEPDLHRLRVRERNYAAVDVTGAVEVSWPGPVWTFVGTIDALDRYQNGLRAGTAVIQRAYHREVEAAFRALGKASWSAYVASTDPPEIPIVGLERVDV